MLAMPRPRPPNLHRETTRHGKVVWYVRDGKGPRIRLRAEFGTADFNNQYDAALKGEAPAGTGLAAPAKPRSLKWLIERYRRECSQWVFVLSAATRKQREGIFRHAIAAAGNEPYARISKATVTVAIARRTPAAGRHFLQAMRGLFKWAVSVDLAQNNPTDDLTVNRPRTEGFKPWSPEWCAAYEAHWPIGTRERVWYEVIHCTGLRRGDAVRVGKQHVRNNRGMIRTQKNDETAYFTITPRLQRALKAGPIGDLTFIVGVKGKSFAKESFGNAFGKACRAAGVPGTAHGIRKTRAIIEAEKGASGPKLDALFGWRTGSNTSAIYIRNANRERLAFGQEYLERKSRS